MNLGTLYLNGVNGITNYELAMKWLSAAANKGHANAHGNISIMYYNGLGVEKNEKLGFQFLEKSADLGSPYSAYNLGMMYNDEDNSLFDLTKAFDYFQSAANKWHPDAQLALAISYFNGNGTQCDFKVAVKWLVLAERLGAKNTEPVREHFEAFISTEDFESGANLAEEILNRN
jgi:TPR repeat protein